MYFSGYILWKYKTSTVDVDKPISLMSNMDNQVAVWTGNVPYDEYSITTFS